mmetsp:Transcript_26262/g.75836  ORF Transcript_26262/g.75836 Transcript_26262/m.75836 type:complete len:443 (+) Transcript_26262:338-1666(+)
MLGAESRGSDGLRRGLGRAGGSRGRTRTGTLLRDFIEHAPKALRPEQDIVGIPRQEVREGLDFRRRVGGEEGLGVEVLVPLPLGIAGAAQLAEAGLEGGLVVGSPVGREAVEDVQRLDGGAPIPLDHLVPQLAQDGVVDVVAAGDLVGNADEALDVLALDGLVVGLCRLEHDLLELGRGEALDLAVDVGRELGGGFPRGGDGGHGRVLDGFDVGDAIADGRQAPSERRGLLLLPPTVRDDRSATTGRSTAATAAAGTSTARRGSATTGRRAAASSTGSKLVLRGIVFVVIVIVPRGSSATAAARRRRSRGTATPSSSSARRRGHRRSALTRGTTGLRHRRPFVVFVLIRRIGIIIGIARIVAGEPKGQIILVVVVVVVGRIVVLIFVRSSARSRLGLRRGAVFATTAAPSAATAGSARRRATGRSTRSLGSLGKGRGSTADG